MLCIKKKPLFYKIGAKIFKYLQYCNKVADAVEAGRLLTKVDPSFYGLNFAFTCEDELETKEEHK